VQGTVLEPCKVAVRLDMGGDAGDIQLTLSDLRMNLSPDVLELALSVQSSVLEPLVQPAPDRYTHPPTWTPSHRVHIAWGGAGHLKAGDLCFPCNISPTSMNVTCLTHASHNSSKIVP